MNSLTAHQLAEERVKLAGEYARLSEELAGILTFKATRWTALRAGCKSDTAAERLWEATEEGMKETRIKLTLKAYEKQMSAQASMLRVMDAEARNTM